MEPDAQNYKQDEFAILRIIKHNMAAVIPEKRVNYIIYNNILQEIGNHKPCIH